MFPKRNFLIESDPALAVMKRWKSVGICCVLTEDGADFDIINFDLDDGGNFQDVPEAALFELGEHYDAILSDLRYWERVQDRVTRIWLEHDPEYRAKYGNPIEPPLN